MTNSTTRKVLGMFAVVFLFAISISLAAAVSCYQENPSVRYSDVDGPLSCGLNYSGSYAQYRYGEVNNAWNDKVRDANWLTYDEEWGQRGWNNRLEINYKMPAEQVNSASLKMKFQIRTTGSAHEDREYNLPIPSRCLASKDTLKLAIYVYQKIQQGDTNFLQVQCYDGSNWINLGDPIHHVYQFRMYEEGMIWDVSPLPASCSQDIDCGEDSTYYSCSLNSRMINHVHPFCANPGTSSSQCLSTTTPEFVENCANGCLNGACIGTGNSECYQEQTDKYTVGDGTCRLNYTGSYRQYFYGEVKERNQEVRDGIWSTYNNEWGLRGWNNRLESDYKLPSEIVLGANLKMKFQMRTTGSAHEDREYTLAIPSQCLASKDTLRLSTYVYQKIQQGDTNFLQVQCYDGSNWINVGDAIHHVYQFRMYEEGITWKIGTAQITCSQNSQCGTDGFVGQPTCSGNSRVRDYRTFTCNNPGQSNSYCSNTTNLRIIETCQYGCTNGQCNSDPGTNNTNPNLIASYSFTDFLKDSAGNHDLTNHGAERVGVCSQYAAEFNGNGSVTHDSNEAMTSNIPSTQTFSVSVWINPANSSHMAVLKGPNGDGWHNGWSIRTYGKEEALSRGIETWNGADNQVRVRAFLKAENGPQNHYIDLNYADINEWTLVTITYDGATLKGYLDGVQKTASSFTGPISYTANGVYPSQFWIGATGGVPNFNGKIDELKVYSGVLNNTEVMRIYNSQKGLFNCSVAQTCTSTEECPSGQICEDGICINRADHKKFYGTAYGDDLFNDPKFLFCGNGKCDNGENAEKCAEDCAVKIIYVQEEAVLISAAAKKTLWDKIRDFFSNLFSANLVLCVN